MPTGNTSTPAVSFHIARAPTFLVAWEQEKRLLTLSLSLVPLSQPLSSLHIKSWRRKGADVHIGRACFDLVRWSRERSRL